MVRLKKVKTLISEAEKSDDPLARDLAYYLKIALNRLHKVRQPEWEAWNRLKLAGLRFKGYDDMDRGRCGDIVIYARIDTNGELIDDAHPKMLRDLDKLFRGRK